MLALTAVLFAGPALSACGESGSSAAKPSKTAAEPETASAPSVRPVGTVVSVGDTPEGLVIDEASRVAVVALRHPDALALVGLDGSHLVRRIATPGRARHLRLVSPTGPLLLPGEDSNAVFEVALPSGTITKRFSTGRQPHDAVAVGDDVWVTDELSGRISILGAKEQSLPSGLQPGGLAEAGGRVAVADVRGNRLYVFDVAKRQQVAVLPAGTGPTHVVAVGATTVAVADTRGNGVLLYELTGKPRLLARLSLPGGPYGLAADEGRHRLWVAMSGRNQLVRVDVESDRLQLSSVRLATVQQPNSVAVEPSTGAVFVAGATAKGSLQLLGRQ